MKRAALLLLLAFGVCLCACSEPAIKVPDEQTDKAAIPAGIATAAPAAEEETEAPVDKGLAIAVFQGETISAPGYYPGVPDEYVQVLDDLYLYNELGIRYSKTEDKSQEIMHELEMQRAKIQRNGNLPYGYSGDGYALVDLDGDGVSELIIRKKYGYYGDIAAVYAIRDGQLQCINNGSPGIVNLPYAIFSSDNTFYQCIDRRPEYADICTFHLEPGMPEFTVVSQAHASLSFSGGDIPEPYWTKTENSETFPITEEEFESLLEQYNNAEEMVMDFVPLHPKAIDLPPAPSPSYELPPSHFEYPAAYEDAPDAYKPILDALFYFEHLLKVGGKTDEAIAMLSVLEFAEFPYLGDSVLGYALADLSGDGVLELLLGPKDKLENAMPNSIFTLKDGKPLYLESFWGRHSGVISADGAIYCDGSDGAAYTLLSTLRLDKNADSLTQLTDIRSDYSEKENKPFYYQIVDGEYHFISREEFFDFWDMYRDPPKRMKLKAIAIAP